MCAAFFVPALAHGQEVVLDTVVYLKAQVVEVLSETQEPIAGTDTLATVQELRIKILEGEKEGEVVTLLNDYFTLKKDDLFYLRYAISGLDGRETYAVSEPYRLPTLLFFVGLFVFVLLAFGGMQGLRGLVALSLSFFFIIYLLIPGILQGYPPVLVSMGVASIIVIAGSYITHGFSRTTSAAVFGMLATIGVTGVMAYMAIHSARMTGFSGEETTYLNFATSGGIDFVGLLLGSILIGLLGVLYDAAIGQAVAVEELVRAGDHNRTHIFTRALRIGREHIGALVNTLAIAYVGASLPLILLFSASSTQSPLVALNQELFASEILRIMLGSIGVILAVPLTTAIAVYMLHGRTFTGPAHHSHHH